jgi:hypothetical protein
VIIELGFGDLKNLLMESENGISAFLLEDPEQLHEVLFHFEPGDLKAVLETELDEKKVLET